MLALALFVVSVSASLKWDLLNPITTTDQFVTAAVREDTVVAFTPTRLFTAAAASRTFVQVPFTINSTQNDLKWRDACYFENASLFMAIGHYTSSAGQSTLMVTNSPNAKTWTVSNQFTLQTSTPSIACGKNEVFLCTGISVFQSIDGKKWTTKSPLVAFDRMNYLPALGYYVAWTVRESAVFTSSNKEIWDFHVGPPKFPFSNIVQGKGVWVIAGNGIVYWSTNLAGWTVSDIPLTSGFTFSGLSFNSALNTFVITAHNVTGLYVFQSSNGNHWVQGIFLPTARQVTTVVSAANLIYALGQTGLVLFSEDSAHWDLLSGNFWTQVGWVTQTSSGWASPAAYRDTVWDDTVPFYTTEDGFAWTRSSTNASDVVLSFTSEPKLNPKTGIYFASDGQVIYSSKDLLTWTAMFSADLQNLQSFTSLYLDPSSSIWVLTAAGPRVDELWTSVDDGNTWTRLMSLPATNKLRRVFPLSATKFITVQLNFYGYWFFLSLDAGVTWKNTSVTVASGEVVWLANSKAVVHVGSWNVTTSALDDLYSWSTQVINISSVAKWLTFDDTFYAIDSTSATPAVWSSRDGVNWEWEVAPYFVSQVHSFASSSTQLFGVADNGVTVAARPQ